MVRLIVGKPGAGKTLFCVREMLGLRRARDKRPIVSNLPLASATREALQPYYHIEDTGHGVRFWEWAPKGSVIYLDEGQLLFDAKDFAELHKKNPELKAYLSHIRHYRDELTVVSHDVGHLDKRLRDLASIFVWMRSTESIMRLFGLPRPSWLPQLFFVSVYYDADFTERMQFRVFKGSSKLYGAYDSYSLHDLAAVRRLDGAVVAQSKEAPVGVCRVGSGSQGSTWWSAVFVGVILGILVSMV